MFNDIFKLTILFSKTLQEKMVRFYLNFFQANLAYEGLAQIFDEDYLKLENRMEGSAAECVINFVIIIKGHIFFKF